MKVSTIQLSSCSGCHVALLNLGAELLNFFSEGQLVFSPVLMDNKSIVKCDVALIEGGIRNSENQEKLKILRENAGTLIALGTCASFGGIPGIGSAFSTSDVLTSVYGNDFTPRQLPVLEKRVLPIDAAVDVDYYIPGCPPPHDHMNSTIKALLTGKELLRNDLPVCAQCKRTANITGESEIKRIADNPPKEDECLLSQGYVCLGSVSRSGCGAPCPAAGVPCMGCRGPIDRVFTEPTHGVFYDLTRRISHFTNKPECEVEEKLVDLIHTFYSFTLSVPEIRRKDSERISKLIYRIKI